jgi:hypothetical protein
MDPRPQAVIALQSGTGGSSLDRDDVGESIEAITGSFPHWFAPRFASYAGRQGELPLDQHQLLALIAPRPILLGTARRDGWADPHGTFQAARGASPAYQLFGVPPFAQARLDEWSPKQRLAVYMRPGPHGIRRSDWQATLDFLDAQMPPAP